MGTATDGTTIEWRGSFTNDEVNRLDAEALETRVDGESEWNGRAAGCEMPHVDFDQDLGFSIDACGFRRSFAGLRDLQP